MEYNDFIAEWNNSLGYIVTNSSGSTGTPKSIRLSKSDMQRSASATVRMFGLSQQSVIASALPLSSIATKMAIVRHIVAKCRYVSIIPSNNFSLPEKVDLLSVGPSQTDCLISHPDMSASIGVLLVGGSQLSVQRRRALINLGYNLYESYGMTETCSNVALRKGDSNVFTANPGISFSTDSRSCLIVRAPQYSFDNTVTNDIVELLTPESFRWLGRYDNVINSGGIKIYPEDLERRLAPMVPCPFYIIGVPEPKWGTAAVMVVEGDEAVAELIRKNIVAFPDHRMLPKRIVPIKHFNYTHTGKIKREIPACLTDKHNHK